MFEYRISGELQKLYRLMFMRKAEITYCALHPEGYYLVELLVPYQSSLGFIDKICEFVRLYAPRT